MDNTTCPKCGQEMDTTTRGGIHLSGGDQWDDIREVVVCYFCGYEEGNNE